MDAAPPVLAQSAHAAHRHRHDHHGAWGPRETALTVAVLFAAGVLAAAALLLARRWKRRASRSLVPCPGCGMFVRPGASCPVCRADVTDGPQRGNGPDAE
jgi:hypothetical protein